jgi:hypothetical protein
MIIAASYTIFGTEEDLQNSRLSDFPEGMTVMVSYQLRRRVRAMLWHTLVTQAGQAQGNRPAGPCGPKAGG